MDVSPPFEHQEHLLTANLLQVLCNLRTSAGTILLGQASTGNLTAHLVHIPGMLSPAQRHSNKMPLGLDLPEKSTDLLSAI